MAAEAKQNVEYIRHMFTYDSIFSIVLFITFFYIFLKEHANKILLLKISEH